MKTFTPRTKKILLAARRTEASRARRLIREHLAGNYPNVVDDVEYCASEIVSNAIEHSDAGAKNAPITVTITELEDRVRVQVSDVGAKKNRPQIKSGKGSLGEKGRGLFMVKTMSHAWGFRVNGLGCVVWFEIKTH